MAELSAQTKPIGSAKRKNSLMSIIDSLHQNHEITPHTTSTAPSQGIDAALRQNEIHLVDTSTPKTSHTTPEQDDHKPQDDSLSSVLNFLYQAASSNLSPSMFHQPQEIGDPPLLEMQNDSSRKSGITQLVECLVNGTPQVKSILKKDADLIFECRKCRGMFRALPNFIRHKKDYCKDSEIPPNPVGNRRKSSTGIEDVSKQTLPRAPPSQGDQPARVQINKIPATPNAVRQKIVLPTSGQYQPTAVPRVPPNITVSRFHIGTVDVSGRPSVSKVMITKSGSFATLSKFSSPIASASRSRSLGTTNPHPYPISAKFTSSKGVRRPKPACPICNKEMAERKNVRRHLVRVHMLSVIESLKLMHSKSPTMAAAKAIAEGETYDKKKFAALKALCKETLEIGDHRVIYVLPENYEFTTTTCPVCSRAVCSKTNLKRHLLEAHNFVLKSEKKYLQLKLFSEKQEAKTPPSLRNLRSIPLVQSQTVVSTIAFDPQSSGTQSDSNHIPRTISNVEQTPQSRALGSSPVEGKQTPTQGRSNPIDVSVNLGEGLIKGNKASADSLSCKENADEKQAEIDAAECRCLTCDKAFTRRQTLQSHMVCIHGWTKEKFGTVYDYSYLKGCSDEQSSSDSDEDSDDAAEPEKPVNGVNDVKNESLLSNNSNSSGSIANDSASKQMSSICIELTNSIMDETEDNQLDESTEPPTKRTKIYDVPLNDKQVFPGSGASQKLIAISRLVAANTGKKIGMATVNIPLVSLKVSANGSAKKCNTTLSSTVSNAMAGTPTHTVPSTSHLTPQNGVDLFPSEANKPSKSLVLRRLVTCSALTSVSVSVPCISTPKTTIEVKPKPPEPSTKPVTDSVSADETAKLANSLPSPSETASPKRTFDINKRICYACNMTFDSPISIKRHLMEFHSFSMEDALATSYDCSDVSEKAQEEARALGYDILLAKCLICNKYYFARGNLAKHMTKIHHLQPDALRHLQGAPVTHQSQKGTIKLAEKVGSIESPSGTKVPGRSEPRSGDPSDRGTPETRVVKKSARIQGKSPASPSALEKNVGSMQAASTAKFAIVNGVWVITKETIAHALKVFPKECINPHALRCVKCKHKYKKAWDLKVHLLKHVSGLGLYACRYCPGPYRLVSCRSKDIQRHVRAKHNKCLVERDRTAFLNDCRVDNKSLWTAYGLPIGKF